MDPIAVWEMEMHHLRLLSEEDGEKGPGQKSLAERVKTAAEFAELRGDPPVEGRFLKMAIEMIEEGKIPVKMLTTGGPCPRAVYEFAVRIQLAAANIERLNTPTLH